MPEISNLTVGQRLFTKTRVLMGNTTMRRTAIHDVVVTEISPDNKWVIASWNGNSAKKYRRRDTMRWFVNEPKRTSLL